VKNRHLNPSQSWEIILAQAQKAFQTNDTWESPKQKRKYRIEEAAGENIVISREGHHQDSVFGKRFVIERINQINSSGGTIARQDWDGHVAKMAAIVHLHPQLKWQDDFETIVVTNLPNPVYEDYGQAPNDDINELQIFARKVRRGQKKFRDILLKAYSGKCCISETAVETVLDACHISPHSADGNNESENGLLLRTDLHVLFDEGLLHVHPDNLTVFFAHELQNTEYWKFDGKRIMDRSDTKSPSQVFLSERWKKKTW